MQPHPDALIPAAVADPAPTRGRARNAKSWTDEESQFADAVLAEWNRCFANRPGGWRANNVRHNRFLAVQFFREQQTRAPHERYELSEVIRAIRAYADSPTNEKLGTWTRFANWFSRAAVEENIDHQLRRIGYNRRRGPIGDPSVKPHAHPATAAPPDPPLTPEQRRVRAFLQVAPWLAFTESAIRRNTTLRAVTEEMGASKMFLGQPEVQAKMLARDQARLDTLLRWEKLTPAEREPFFKRARTGFEQYFGRAPIRVELTGRFDRHDQLRLEAIALTLFEKTEKPPESQK